MPISGAMPGREDALVRAKEAQRRYADLAAQTDAAMETRDRRVAEACEAGYTRRQVAEATGISSTQVMRILAKV